jgi:hypothetical protein
MHIRKDDTIINMDNVERYFKWESMGKDTMIYYIYFNVLSKNDFNISFTSEYSRSINFEKIFDGLQRDSRIVILVDIPDSLIPENMKLEKLEINDAQFKI